MNQRAQERTLQVRRRRPPSRNVFLRRQRSARTETLSLPRATLPTPCSRRRVFLFALSLSLMANASRQAAGAPVEFRAKEGQLCCAACGVVTHSILKDHGKTSSVIVLSASTKTHWCLCCCCPDVSVEHVALNKDQIVSLQHANAFSSPAVLCTKCLIAPVSTCSNLCNPCYEPKRHYALTASNAQQYEFFIDDGDERRLLAWFGSLRGAPTSIDVFAVSESSGSASPNGPSEASFVAMWTKVTADIVAERAKGSAASSDTITLLESLQRKALNDLNALGGTAHPSFTYSVSDDGRELVKQNAHF